MKAVPDLAFEVVITGVGIDKLEVYRGLGVAEVLFWQSGRFSLHRLGSSGYELATASAILPGLDLERVASLLATPSADHTAIVRAFRDSLR